MKCLDSILETEMKREDSVNILCDNNDIIDLFIGNDSIFDSDDNIDDEEDYDYGQE